MSKPAISTTQGRVVALEQTAKYWHRRALRHCRQGEMKRAAALLRHAVTLEPSSTDLRMEYARALRELGCFEGSNREAFEALAVKPGEYEPYRVIGRNMLSLGRQQEAADAFTHYFQEAHTHADALAYDDEYDTDELYWEDVVQYRNRRGMARFEALLHIASQRLARGDAKRAAPALARAEAFFPEDGRLHALYAMLWQASGQYPKALDHALKSVQANPGNVAALCGLAGIREGMGHRGKAATALLAGICYSRFPHEEQLLCLTAMNMGFAPLVKALLARNRRRMPDRVPTLYNWAVLRLWEGEAGQAEAALSRCLDIDPEDVAARGLYRCVTGWQERGLTEDQVREQGACIPFYPLLPPHEEQKRLERLAEALGEGVDGFAQRLLEQEDLRRTFLYTLSLPQSPLGRLLFLTAGRMAATDAERAERLLREALTQNAHGDEVQRYAIAALCGIGAKPPYVIWQDGRIVQVDPLAQPVREPSSLQKMLFWRLQRLQQLAGDSRVVAHAWGLLRRMSRRQRYSVALDVRRCWREAMLRHFFQNRGILAIGWNQQEDPKHEQRIQDALRTLCDLAPRRV